jgi:hypothetical protein
LDRIFKTKMLTKLSKVEKIFLKFHVKTLRVYRFFADTPQPSRTFWGIIIFHSVLNFLSFIFFFFKWTNCITLKI